MYGKLLVYMPVFVCVQVGGCDSSFFDSESCAGPKCSHICKPPGQVPSNRVLLNAVQSEASMCTWCV